MNFAKLRELLRKSRFSQAAWVCGTNAWDRALDLPDALPDAVYWAKLGGTSSPNIAARPISLNEATNLAQPQARTLLGVLFCGEEIELASGELRQSPAFIRTVADDP